MHIIMICGGFQVILYTLADIAVHNGAYIAVLLKKTFLTLIEKPLVTMGHNFSSRIVGIVFIKIGNRKRTLLSAKCVLVLYMCI